ncbi:MAG: hypothetical protein ACKPHU_13515, partial [Planctomycetaceae bacterium]
MAVTVGEGFRKQEQDFGVIGELLQDWFEEFGSEGRVTFVEGQSGSGDESFGAIWVVATSAFEEAFLNGFWVGAQL